MFRENRGVAVETCEWLKWKCAWQGVDLAYSDPFVQVYLIENKEESLAKAQSRIAAMGTNNIVLYQVRSSRSDFCKYMKIWVEVLVFPSFFLPFFLFIGSSKW